jgi:Putative zinc-finger
MNCEQAGHLFDDYLENELRRYDRQRLETHLASCPQCVAKLRSRSALDQAIRQALATSVQHRMPSPEASMRMIRAAQGNVRQAIWSNHVLLALRTMASLVAAALVFVGLFFLIQRIPAVMGISPATLLPLNQLALSERSPATLAPVSQLALPELQPITQYQANQPALTISNSDLRLEPEELQPHGWFTLTLFLHSDLPQPVDIARFDLEISGPPGYYRFPLTLKGPLPAHGISIFQITPDHLADLCEKQYLISPVDIFKEPGKYAVRVTLFSPVLTPEQ